MKKPSSGVSRRDLAVAFTAAAAVTSAGAQQPAAGPATAEDLLTTARQQARSTSEALRKFKVPVATEPSFTFRP